MYNSTAQGYQGHYKSNEKGYAISKKLKQQYNSIKFRSISHTDMNQGPVRAKRDGGFFPTEDFINLPQ